MTIEKAVWIALRPTAGKLVQVHSLDFQETFNLDSTNLHKGEADWREYIKGVAWAMQDSGLDLSGWQGVVGGDVPIGSGLSSSAAFQLAVAAAFAASSGRTWTPLRIAQLVQKAENDWMGVNTGIMDPLISAIAEGDKAALIDCRSLDIRHVAIPSDAAVVIMNTMRARGLVDSAYNERREQCEEVAIQFKVQTLREITMEVLNLEKSKLSATLFHRARHVVSESERALRFADLMESNDPVVAGKLMWESHLSLRDDYEVSCEELNIMVEEAMSHPGCFGARMTGAGFGGCAVALVKSDLVSKFIPQVSTDYEGVTGIVPQLFVSRPGSGLQISSF